MTDRDPLRLAYLSIGRHIHTERWLKWFAKRGHDVHLLTVQPGPIDGVTVHDITPPPGPKPLRYAIGLIQVKRILKRVRPHLLHTHFLTGYGYWGAFSGWRPFLLTVWGDDVYVTPHENWLKGSLAGRALQKADYVTGDSMDIVKACIKLGASSDRVEVIQWGVDFDQFNPAVGGEGIRKQLGIPEDAPVVLSTRSFTKDYYNIDLVIDSAVEVRKACPSVHYIMAGHEGDDARYRTLARARGINDRIHWVGRIPHADLAAYINASSVFVTVPSVDATAVSLLEAMACGAAVVTTDLPSALEWIEHDVTGIAIPHQDTRALVGGIVELIGDPDLRARLGRDAERVVRSRADHKRSMKRVEDIYYNFARGETPSPPTVI